MKKIIDVLVNVFRYHKKKILFFLGSVAFCFIVLFPYDDLSDFITQQISIRTSNNLYVQFDNLSFGFLPQLGLKMNNVIVESVFAPTMAVKTLGVAPSLTSLLFGTPGGKLKAYGLFGGDTIVSLGRSNELDIDTTEFGVDIEVEGLELKKLTKFLKSSYNFPMQASGMTQLESKLHVDPTFKEQPKGDFQLNIKNVNIASTTLPIGNFMSYSLPAIKLSQLTLIGKIDDRKFIIQEGKLGDPKNDLHGEITGEFIMDIQKGGAIKMGGYDLKVNLNISDNLKRQLTTVLTFIDIYQNIGKKYKFDSLKGVRYSLRLSSRNMKSPPRVTGF